MLLEGAIQPSSLTTQVLPILHSPSRLLTGAFPTDALDLLDRTVGIRRLDLKACDRLQKASEQGSEQVPEEMYGYPKP